MFRMLRAGGTLIQMRVPVRNRLAGVLLHLAEQHRPEDVDDAALDADAADALSLTLVRMVRLPGVPRPGERVVVHPGGSPCWVEELEWLPDPQRGEPAVQIYLTEFNEDEIELDDLLDAGWRPEA